jgi:hypothetical protein
MGVKPIAIVVAIAALGCGGNGAALPPVPTCLESLVAACPLEGTCSFARNEAGAAGRFCFASGRTLERLQVTACAADAGVASATTVETVRNADGSVCYTREWSCACAMACEFSALTWRNAAGEAVAAEELTSNGYHSVVCSGGATSGVDCSRPNAPGGCTSWPSLPDGRASATASCAEGNCP